MHTVKSTSIDFLLYPPDKNDLSPAWGGHASRRKYNNKTLKQVLQKNTKGLLNMAKNKIPDVQ
jgi:hypothetical protein